MNASRVSTAAATASVVPFHCVICFEEFNLGLRFPVVLPCGHTFVCNCCARRLRRCMECREPLFWTAPTAGSNGSGPVVPKTPPTNARGPPRYQRRYQAPSSPGPPTSSPAAEPVPLPLPKNLVLMAMMEAAERQQAQEHKLQQHRQDFAGKSGSFESEDDDDDEEGEEDEDEFDLNRIISGMVTFSGPCGTYAVRDPQGLTVLPSHPNTSVMARPSTPSMCPAEADKGENKDAIKRAARNGRLEVEAPAVIQSQSDACTSPGEAADPGCAEFTSVDGKTGNEADDSETGENGRESFHISQGQTLQIVDFADGVAKLARGAGFIVASSSQLVKVGGPLDRCCRLEGVLDTFVLRGKDLKAALDENLKIEVDLRTTINLERGLPSNYPIITDPPELDEMATPEHQKFDANDNHFHSDNPPLLPRSPREVVVTEASDSSGMELVGEIGNFMYSSKPPSSPCSIDNSDLPGMPRYRRNSEDDLNSFAYGCGSALFGKGFLNFNNSNDPRMALSYSLDEDVETISQPRLTDSAMAQEIGTPPPPIRQTADSSLISAATPMLSSSFETVDWRAMSCHRGLSKTSPHGLSKTSPRSRMMMSEHRGIGSSRVPRQPNGLTTHPALAPPFPSAYPHGHDEKH